MLYSTVRKTLALVFFFSVSIFGFSQNNAIDFNGSGYVNVGSPLPAASSYTKEAWINTPGTGNILSSSQDPFWFSNVAVLSAGNGSYQMDDGSGVVLKDLADETFGKTSNDGTIVSGVTFVTGGSILQANYFRAFNKTPKYPISGI